MTIDTARAGDCETPDLKRLLVHPIARDERARWDALMAQHHYLNSSSLVGDALRYVATIEGRWMALLGWATPAMKCRPRDQWIGWSESLQWRRLRLVVNNARFLVLPGPRIPNLASKTLSLNCRRLSRDWRAAFGHPALVAETFVDPSRYRGICYIAAGWRMLGTTKGYGRSGGHYYYHGEGKLIFARPLSKGACKLLADPAPHPELLTEDRTIDILSMPLRGQGSLHEALSQVSDYRSLRGKRFRQIQGLLTIAAAAVLAGNRSYAAIAQWAATLPEDLRRDLGCTYCRRARGFRAPSADTLRRAISNVDAEEVDRATCGWLLRQGISLSGNAIAIDGKVLRGSYSEDHKAVHLLAALTHREGAVIAQQKCDDKSNEIPVARELLDDLNIAGAMITADAMHTQVDTADYLKKRARTTY